MKRDTSRWLGRAAVSLVACLFAGSVQAMDSPVVPPWSTPFGKPFRQWTAEWWQKMFSIPSDSSPLVDETGEDCMVGQNGKVWFLAGSLSGGKIERRCKVPEGTFLFFPVLNSFGVNAPDVCGQVGELSAADMRRNAAPFIDAATGLHVAIDGRPVGAFNASPQRFRVRSQTFAATFPRDNIFVEPCAGVDPPGFPPGIYSPGVDDGYYVMLKPLPVGYHTLRFSGASGDFALEVEYRLKVVPVSTE